MAKKKPRKRRIRLVEPDELEQKANAALVHAWCVCQCEIDPEFRETYELYIGPVPTRTLDYNGMRNAQQ